MVDSLSSSRAFTVGNDGGWFTFIVGKKYRGKFGRHSRKMTGKLSNDGNNAHKKRGADNQCLLLNIIE